jgi:hypothetical protein
MKTKTITQRILDIPAEFNALRKLYTKMDEQRRRRLENFVCLIGVNVLLVASQFFFSNVSLLQYIIVMLPARTESALKAYSFPKFLARHLGLIGVLGIIFGGLRILRLLDKNSKTDRNEVTKSLKEEHSIKDENSTSKTLTESYPSDIAVENTKPLLVKLPDTKRKIGTTIKKLKSWWIRSSDVSESGQSSDEKNIYTQATDILSDAAKEEKAEMVKEIGKSRNQGDFTAVQERLQDGEARLVLRKTLDSENAKNLKAEEARVLEEKRRAEEARILEEKRRAEEARVLEEKRRAEEARVLEEKRRAEEARVLEEKRRAEEARILEEKRRAEEARILEKKRRAEEARILEEKRRAEEARILEEKRRAEEARILEEKQRAEEARILEEKRRAEEARILEEKRRAEEARILEEKQRAEEARILEEKRRAEEARILEDKRRAEEARELEEKRRAEEARILEEKRRAEEVRILEEKRRAEEARILEEKRRAEEARILEEKQRAEEARILEEKRRAEEARILEEKRRAEEARILEEKQRAEEARILEEKRRAEEARILEDKRRAEEARVLEEKRRAEEARILEERKLGRKAIDHISSKSVGGNAKYNDYMPESELPQAARAAFSDVEAERQRQNIPLSSQLGGQRNLEDNSDFEAENLNDLQGRISISSHRRIEDEELPKSKFSFMRFLFGGKEQSSAKDTQGSQIINPSTAVPGHMDQNNLLELTGYGEDTFNPNSAFMKQSDGQTKPKKTVRFASPEAELLGSPESIISEIDGSTDLSVPSNTHNHVTSSSNINPVSMDHRMDDQSQISDKNREIGGPKTPSKDENLIMPMYLLPCPVYQEDVIAYANFNPTLDFDPRYEMFYRNIDSWVSGIAHTPMEIFNLNSKTMELTDRISKDYLVAAQQNQSVSLPRNPSLNRISGKKSNNASSTPHRDSGIELRGEPTVINYSGASLRSFPVEKIRFESVTELILDNNFISQIPGEILPYFINLRVLNISYNDLDRIPEEICFLKSLEFLYLRKNNLRDVLFF